MSSSGLGRASISRRRSSSRNFFWSWAAAGSGTAARSRATAMTIFGSIPLLLAGTHYEGTSARVKQFSVVVALRHPENDPDRAVVRDRGPRPRGVAAEERLVEGVDAVDPFVLGHEAPLEQDVIIRARPPH